MKFDFNGTPADYSIHTVPELLAHDEMRRYFSLMLRLLKKESACPLYDDDFETWVLKEWGIKFLHENVVYPSHLTGLEMDDSTLTMLLIKFPPSTV